MNTYLKRLFPKGGQDLRVGVLSGTSEEHDGVPYLFVDGALEMEDVAEQGEKVELTESAWKEGVSGHGSSVSETVGAWLVFMRCAGCGFKSLKLLETAWTVFCREKPADVSELWIGGEEAVYITSEDGFYKLRGYHIYYERNQMMQDYMIMRKDVRRVETGTGEPVVRDFRQRMEENKSQITSKTRQHPGAGSLCQCSCHGGAGRRRGDGQQL